MNKCACEGCEREGIVNLIEDELVPPPADRLFCKPHAIAFGFCPKCGTMLHLEGVLSKEGFSSEYCLCFDCGIEVIREWELQDGERTLINYYGLAVDL